MLMLDYQAKPRPHRYGFVALALAVAGLGGLALDYYDVVYALEAAAVEVGALDRVDRANAAPGPRDVKEVRAQVQEIAQANRVLRELSVPWEMLFQAVESAGGKDVTLVALEPDAEKHVVKIVAEARSFAAVLDYLRELQGQASLRDVMLQHHQVDAQDPEQPVRFSVTATWEEQP